jgi:hypothetical protein
MSEENSNYNLGTDYVNIKTTTVVRLDDQVILFSENGPITLKIDITADFGTVDPKYHEVFMNIMTSRYLGKVSFGDNPFSVCKPLKKRKWWQFWKAKYFTA